MSTKVLRFDGALTQTNMISRLEQALEDVRGGKVRGLTIVTLDDDDAVWISNHWTRWFDSLGALAAALTLAGSKDD